MKPDEAAKLLGGYATGTLTEAERQALFDAALSDQELFNALAGDHALKDLLDDPVSRRRVLQVLDEPKPSAIAWFAAWFRRPMAWAAAGGLAATALLVTMLVRTGAPLAPEPVALRTRQQATPPPSVAGKEEPPASGLMEQESARPAAPAQGPVLSGKVEPKPAEKAEHKEADIKVIEGRQAAAGGQVALNEPQPSAQPAPPPAREAEFAATSQPRRAAVLRDVAQEKPGGQARQLYYQAQKPPATLQSARSIAAEESVVGAKKDQAADESGALSGPAAQVLGIRCSILKVGPGGSYMEVDPQAPLRSGDRIRVSIESNDDGQLHLLRSGPAGKRDVFFQGPIKRGTRYNLPAGDSIRLEGPSGEIRIVATFSRVPIAELGQVSAETAGRDERAKQGPMAKSRAEQDQAAAGYRRLRSDDRVLVDRLSASATGGVRENAIYAVSAQPGSDSPIVLEVPIRWD
jgi:hypothetical protein